MKPVIFNPRAQRLIIELSGSSGRVETRKRRIFTVLMLVFAVFHFTSPMRVLAGGIGPWGAQAELVVVGSTGTVDESDLDEYEMRNQQATIKAGVIGTVIYRYNLPAVKNFQDGTSPKTVRIRYRDTGTAQNIVVRLKAAHLGEDGVDTIYTFNSDSGSTGGGLAGPDTPNPNVNGNQTFDECDVTFVNPDHILHGRYGYFLEVELTRTANDGTSGPVFIAFVMSSCGITDVACGSVAA